MRTLVSALAYRRRPPDTNDVEYPKGSGLAGALFYPHTMATIRTWSSAPMTRLTKRKRAAFSQ